MEVDMYIIGRVKLLPPLQKTRGREGPVKVVRSACRQVQSRVCSLSASPGQKIIATSAFERCVGDA